MEQKESAQTQYLKTDVAIIGAGPAGLTAAYQLTKAGLNVIVLEKAALVGGISRTERYKGYHVDIGGHRFYTKIDAVNTFWHEVMGDDFLRRPRLSRIYYNRKFFHYPIRPFDALFNLGLVESTRVVLSYLHSQLFPYPSEESFEEWVSNRFGRRLYQVFFKTYTEKVWGIPCHEIKAEWAAQRIKGLSLPVAIRNALLRPRNQSVKTLIEEFHYPRQGPGMLWEKVQALVEAQGNRVLTEHEVVRLNCNSRRIATITAQGPCGETLEIEAAHIINSMPLSQLIKRINPAPPVHLLDMAGRLAYRDFLTVALIVRQPELFPDNWIYIHSPEVEVGRIQNFKNWSPYMVPNGHTTCLGLEYFCTEGDRLWQMADADLIDLGRREVAQIGLLNAEDVVDGVVFRQPKAYPVYTGEYKLYLEDIKAYIDTIPNLQTAGRNGLHMYNNQDHSMLTAMLAVKNILGEQHDIWTVNTERSYHEEVRIPHAEKAA
ncbi:MAG: NAD(P)/FAD-dependent oxidoreductase [Anaerolineae bacterium]|nr:NAD(P)/FAD-dependent oxidoreductase [Anaerolineae bacterium]